MARGIPSSRGMRQNPGEKRFEKSSLSIRETNREKGGVVQPAEGFRKEQADDQGQAEVDPDRIKGQDRRG